MYRSRCRFRTESRQISDRISGRINDREEHRLGDVERRHRVERETDHETQLPERHHGAIEVGITPVDGHDVTTGRHQLDRPHGGCPTAVWVARAVGSGEHRSCHAEMGQGRQVGERAGLGMQEGAEVAVTNARLHPYRACVSGSVIGHPAETLGGTHRADRQRDGRASANKVRTSPTFAGWATFLAPKVTFPAQFIRGIVTGELPISLTVRANSPP